MPLESDGPQEGARRPGGRWHLSHSPAFETYSGAHVPALGPPRLRVVSLAATNVRGKLEMERGAVLASVVLPPEAPAVRCGDRPADRQAEAESGGLRCEERLEHSISRVDGEANV